MTDALMDLARSIAASPIHTLVVDLLSITREIVPWTWGAFAIALATGLGLFITRASAYVENRAFQIKLLLLLLAGINVIVLHFVTLRSADRQNAATMTTAPAKVAGACSLLVWMGVMLAGRWIGHLT